MIKTALVLLALAGFTLAGPVAGREDYSPSLDYKYPTYEAPSKTYDFLPFIDAFTIENGLYNKIKYVINILEAILLLIN
jgi:hypothetical protein